MNTGFLCGPYPIGSADGPAEYFIAGELGVQWLNLLGMIFVILLLIPNIVYASKNKDQKNQCRNMLMNALEQTGRFACMFLMAFNIGIAEFGFGSVTAFLIYLFGNIILMAVYWIIWIMFFKKKTPRKQIALAVIPTLLFLSSGITLRHYLLVLAAVIFGVGHIYVTCKNIEYEKEDAKHSEEFRRIRRSINGGYEYAYTEYRKDTFDKIYDWERSELEDIIWSYYLKGTIKLAALLPYLQKYDGISKLREDLASPDTPEGRKQEISLALKLTQ